MSSGTERMPLSGHSCSVRYPPKWGNAKYRKPVKVFLVVLTFLQLEKCERNRLEICEFRLDKSKWSIL
jgi:hypothetical protein